MSRRLESMLQHSWSPALLLLVAGTAVVIGRLLLVAHGDPTQFAVIGSRFAASRGLPAHAHIFPGSGYDGQFSYRLALAPGNVRLQAHGLSLDSPLRAQRVGLSLLAWLLAFGQVHLVPWTLIIVNLFSLAAGGLAAAFLAAGAGRSPMWGLLPAAYWAQPTSLGRDLTEVLSVTCVLACLLAWTRHKPVLAGLALLLGVLTRETDLLVVAGLMLYRLSTLLRHDDAASTDSNERVPGRMDLAWLLPLVGYGVWQVYCYAEIDSWPATATGDANVAFPFTGIVPFVQAWIHEANSFAGALRLTQALTLALILLAAGFKAVGPAPLPLRICWMLLAGLVICLSRSVYVGPEAFRTAAEAYTLSALLILWLQPMAITFDLPSYEEPSRTGREQLVTCLVVHRPGPSRAKPALAVLASLSAAMWIGQALLRIHSI